MARRKGFEPLTFWSVARRSIQLSCDVSNLSGRDLILKTQTFKAKKSLIILTFFALYYTLICLKNQERDSFQYCKNNRRKIVLRLFVRKMCGKIHKKKSAFLKIVKHLKTSSLIPARLFTFPLSFIHLLHIGLDRCLRSGLSFFAKKVLKM